MVDRTKTFDKLSITRILEVPKIKSIPDLDFTPPAGSIIYNSQNGALVVSDGFSVGEILPTMPPPPVFNSLYSISPILPNRILYTSNTDTLAQTSITELGRNIVASELLADVQNTIGLVPGTTVQQQSAVLSAISSLNPIAGDRVLTTSSLNSFVATPISAYTKTILGTADAAAYRTVFSAVERAPTTTANAIALHDGTNGLLDSSILVSGGTTLTGIADATLTGTLVSETVNTEFIENTIGTLSLQGNSIPDINWVYVSDMQDVSTLATPNFLGMGASGSRITGVGNPTSGTDAATKGYVDSSLSGVGNPYGSIRIGTTGELDLTGGGEAGAGIGKTIEGTIANIGTIDAVVLVVSDRVLVRQGTSVVTGSTSSSNGIYEVTQIAPTVILTRATDADEASEITTGRSVFITEGTQLAGSSWVVSTAPTTVDTDPIEFSQTGSSQVYVDGDGIDITGQVISVDAVPAAFSFTGGALDIIPAGLPLTKGGTGAVSFAAGSRLLQTNAGNTAIEASSLVPSTVTTDTNSQTFQNKTMDTTGSGNVVSIDGITLDAGAIPAEGDVLKIVGGSLAQWQTPQAVSEERVVRVAQSNGDYTTLAAAIVAVNAGTIPGGVPTATNWVMIRVASGLYVEVNPIVVPSFCVLYGEGYPIFVGTNTAIDCFQLTSNTVLENIRVADHFDGTAFKMSSAPGSGKPTVLKRCIADNVNIGFYVAGTGAPFSSRSYLLDCACNVSATMVGTTDYGFLVDGNASIILYNPVDVGNPASVATLDMGVRITGTGTLVALYNYVGIYIGNGLSVGSGATARVYAPSFSAFSGTGVTIDAGACIQLFSGNITDDTPTYPNQQHIVASGTASKVEISGLTCRQDLVTLPVTIDTLTGSILNTNPNEPTFSFISELSVGLADQGYESTFGEGDSRAYGRVVKTYNANTLAYTDITTITGDKDGSAVLIFPSNTVGDILYIASVSPYTTFYGVKLINTVLASPAGGREPGTTPPVYRAIWEYWDGTIWREIRTMSTEVTAPHNTFSADTFANMEEHVRFDDIWDRRGPLGSGSTFVSANANAQKWVTQTAAYPNWGTTTVDGTTGYFVRYRLTTPFTVVPEVDHIKLHTSRTEINADGFMEYFGKSMPLVHSGGDFSGPYVLASNTPNSLLDSTLGLNSGALLFNFSQNVLRDNRLAGYGFVYAIERKVDTSKGIDFTWKWTKTTSSANSVRWIVTWSYSRTELIDGGNVSTVYTDLTAPATSSPEQVITFEQVGSTTANKQIVTSVRLDVSDVRHDGFIGDGDVVWIALQRDGINDAYSGDVNYGAVGLYKYVWCTGSIA